MHISPVKFTVDCFLLLEEEKYQVLFGKEMAKLSKKFPKTMWKIKATNSVPSVCSFLSKEGDMFEKYYELQNTILFQALQVMVCEIMWDKKCSC